MHPRILICICLSLGGPAAVRAVTFDIEGATRQALAHNPNLAAARLRIDEAKARLLGSGRLANPELEFEFQSDRRGEERNVAAAFEQSFPLTSRLRLEKKVSSQWVQAAELEVRNKERLLIAEVQSLAVKLLALDQQAALRKQQTALAQELSDFASKRAGQGEISPLDAAQAQVDSQRLLFEGRRIETERVSLLGELKPKLGLAAADSLAISGSLPEAKMPARASWEQRADYQLSKVIESAALTEIDLAKARKWEDVTTGLMWEKERSEDAPFGLENNDFIGFRVSIPLPFWNRNQGEIAEKNAGAQRAQLETRAMAAEIENEAAAARAEMAAHASLAKETKEKLLPLVIEQTERLEKAYQTGQTDLMTVLRAREERLQLEAAVLDATREFHLARIRYEMAVGKHAPANPAKQSTHPSSK